LFESRASQDCCQFFEISGKMGAAASPCTRARRRVRCSTRCIGPQGTLQSVSSKVVAPVLLAGETGCPVGPPAIFLGGGVLLQAGRRQSRSPVQTSPPGFCAPRKSAAPLRLPTASSLVAMDTVGFASTEDALTEGTCRAEIDSDEQIFTSPPQNSHGGLFAFMCRRRCGSLMHGQIVAYERMVDLIRS